MFNQSKKIFGVLILSVASLTWLGCGEDSATPDPDPETYTIGGNVTGLTGGQSVVVKNNGGDNLTVNDNGSFEFPTEVEEGSAYSVTAQPSSGGCSVTNGNGTAEGNVTTITVTCQP